MEVVKTGNPSKSKVSELEEFAHQADKFEMTVSFTLDTGAEASFKITCKGVNSNFIGERVGYKGPSTHQELVRSMTHLIQQFKVASMNALILKLTGGNLPAKQVRPLAIAAWAEVAGIPCPAEADVGKEILNAKARQEEMRKAMLSDLRGGEEGLQRFRARSHADNALVKHLREVDLSNLNLHGIAFSKAMIEDMHKSTFVSSDLSNAQFVGCDLSNCDFSHATMDGAVLRSAGCTEANFAKASLQKAILRGATLQSANLTGANLTGADLAYADLRGANLATANLTDASYGETAYDEYTKWPPDYTPPIADPVSQRGIRFLVFRGEGRDPFLMQQVQAMAPGGSVDFGTFLSRLDQEFDQARLKKSLKMLQGERFQLFAEVAPDSLVGVVKSQTDPTLVYSCRITQNGTYACCTQNLNPCGGLRGALCKHLLVLLIGITKGGELDAALACEWVLGSKQHKNATLDKDVMTATLLRYKGAEAGEIDWRPTETMPEDYYAY